MTVYEYKERIKADLKYIFMSLEKELGSEVSFSYIKNRVNEALDATYEEMQADLEKVISEGNRAQKIMALHDKQRELAGCKNVVQTLKRSCYALEILDKLERMGLLDRKD